ncbi:MAG: N-formylglutamate deformylase [Paraglaciecola sp.]|jgi:N-formylglutamate deformylase
MNHIQNPFTLHQGNSPLLVSMPHSGLALPPEVATGLSQKARLLPDTDWYIPQLYNFLHASKAGFIQANYSRYVIDLNRPIDDKPLYASATTGLFPEILFDGSPVFTPGAQPTLQQRDNYKQQIWLAYHMAIQQELSRLKEKFGYAILFDAHSIAAQVPMLFEGQLPDFNFGTNGGLSCDDKLLDGLAEVAGKSSYTHVCNGRFKGGYITRHFGAPQNHIHAIQLELSQTTYLQDNTQSFVLDTTKLGLLLPVLQQLVNTLLTVPVNL